jgi:hypothetical protein
VVLSLVVAGLHPLVVVAGAVELGPGLRGITDSGRSAVSLLGAWHVRGALRRFAAVAQEAGGREVLVSRLPELVHMAGERLSWRAAAEYDLGELAREERFRSCPRCAEQSEAGMRWCTGCEYEFTAADDHAHDLRNAGRRQQADRLRHGLAQILIDEFPPVSAAPGIPVPSAGSWAARS